MTTIVGAVDNGKVFLGGDCQGVIGNTKIHGVGSKVFKKGEFIIGFSGDARGSQIISCSFNPPEIKENQDVMEYMVADFVNEMRNSFSLGGFKEILNSVDNVCGHTLVGFRGRLFMIDSGFAVTETADGFTAIGSGRDHAITSMYTSHNYSGFRNVDIKDRLMMALDVASYYDIYTGKDFTFTETD